MSTPNKIMFHPKRKIEFKPHKTFTRDFDISEKSDEDNLRYEKEMVEYFEYLDQKQLDEDRKQYEILREKLGIKE